VILAGTEEAERAEAALVEGGFGPRDIKRYTCKQILDNHEAYMGRRAVTSKVCAPWQTTSRGRQFYLGTYVRIDSRCGWAFLTKPMCSRLSGYLLTTGTSTRATTALSSRPTCSPPQPLRRFRPTTRCITKFVDARTAARGRAEFHGIPKGFGPRQLSFGRASGSCALVAPSSEGDRDVAALRHDPSRVGIGHPIESVGPRCDSSSLG
jgi:hypothetical protein